MILCALALTSCLAAAPVPKGPPKPEGLEGDWKVVVLTSGGALRAPDEAPLSVVIKGDKMTVNGEGPEERATFTLDPKQSPSTIDLKPAASGDGASALKGIYKIDKGVLTLCFGTQGDRPKEFRSPARSSVVLIILERVSK